MASKINWSSKTKGFSLYTGNNKDPRLGDRAYLERSEARVIGMTYLFNKDKDAARKLIRSKKEYGSDGIDRIFAMFKQYIEGEWE